MTTATPPTIGEITRVERAKTGMTQEKLGALIGVSRMTIHMIESELSNPGFPVAYLLARELDFSLDTVMPNITPKMCVCPLFGPDHCSVCFPHGYKKA